MTNLMTRYFNGPAFDKSKAGSDIAGIFADRHSHRRERRAVRFLLLT
jgi:hypothetical protein